MTIPLVGAVHNWYCPACKLTDQTVEVRPHVRFHSCPKLGGLTAPMVRAGTRAKIEARLREDYVGQEKVHLNHDGRPVMSLVTTRDDGQDCTIFAPTATGLGAM